MKIYENQGKSMKIKEKTIKINENRWKSPSYIGCVSLYMICHFEPAKMAYEPIQRGQHAPHMPSSPHQAGVWHIFAYRGHGGQMRGIPGGIIRWDMYPVISCKLQKRGRGRGDKDYIRCFVREWHQTWYSTEAGWCTRQEVHVPEFTCSTRFLMNADALNTAATPGPWLDWSPRGVSGAASKARDQWKSIKINEKSNENQWKSMKINKNQ